MTFATQPRRTALYDAHKALGARLVDFHGWELPIQYQGILKEHQAVRSSCGIFDVSHMGQIWARGPQALAFLQKTNTNDVSRIGPGKAVYSHLPNERGGVVDDVIISCLAPDRYLIVVNAATLEKDFRWLQAQAQGFKVELENASDLYGMVAVQGPEASRLMGLDFPQVQDLPRFGALELSIFDQPGVITRTGYTGEDGFEIIAPAEIISRVWDDMLAKGRSFGLMPCGLGARDTLRLEAGYLLYGQDIDEDHTSFEADYGWVVKLEKGDFIGKQALLMHKREGLKRRLTGIKLLEPGVPRAGAEVLVEGEVCGALCSATFSPSLQAGIGVGYLSRPDLGPGAQVEVKIHGRQVPAEIVKPPFYSRGTKNAKA
ncbi:MAG: glycine cleavage system aminomethyltransferase GcvT [Elusimicrobia bacterium]|nr:glycine cleavage system aminomethyltransferase GcvT [Elusimicrobiota bacterium]